jgi:hypothetical protein
MTSDAAVLELVRRAFSECQKPEHFTNYEHCDECQEHDDVLRSRDVDSLAIEDVGNSCWDPLCYTSAEGLAYYFPALARLVLADPMERFGWYGPQFLFQLRYDGQRNRFLMYSTAEQKMAVVALLKHIGATRQDQLANWVQVDELQAAIGLWSETHPGDDDELGESL